MELTEIDYWPVAKQTAYHREQLEKAIRTAAWDAEVAYRDKHPQAGSLRTRSDIHVYRRPPKGFYQHAVKMVELLMVSRIARHEPNSAFVARLNDKFSPYVVSKSLLTRTLSPTAMTQIEKVLARNGVWLDLRKHSTLSKIKLALRAKLENPSMERSYVLPISFHGSAVVVGEIRLPIYKHTAGYYRVRVGKQWLRCDALEDLVRQGTG